MKFQLFKINNQKTVRKNEIFKSSHFRKFNLVIFALIFVGVGGYLLIQSRAATVDFNFPYPVATNNRKLIDQNGQVYLLKTMSDWALAQNGTNAEITSALEGLKNLGFNAVTVAPMGNYYGTEWDRYHNISGQPFFTGTPLASPLGTGWSSMDWVMSEATRLQMTVVLSIYTGNGNTQGIGNDLIAAGNTNAYNFGRNLATRYSQYPNIIWHIGADAGWNYNQNPGPMVENVMKGISEIEGTTHRLQVAEPAPGGGSTGYTQFISQESTGGPGYQYLKLNVNSVYNYGGSSVDQFDTVYNQAGATSYPVWDCEPPYVDAPHYSGNRDQQQRERNYSTFIRGGVGINYGHEYWWPTGKFGVFEGGPGWLNKLSDAPQLQAGYTWNLVDNYIKDSTWAPDNNTFLKTGLGSGDTRAASGYSQTSAVAYFPSNRTVTVNTAALPGIGMMRLRWFDPTTGTYTTIADSEARNTNRTVTYPANHSDGTSDWVLVVSTVAGSDITTPTISLTAPANGASVANTVNFSANASDDVGVYGVQFKVDGNNAGTEDITAPYSISWDSFSVANGTHTVSATARDTTGNSTTSNSVTITVNNTGNLTIGETSITPSADNGNANLLLAQQATLNQTATIQSMSFYVTTAAGKLRLGIYDATGPSGGPGAKKAETAEFTPVVGWNTAGVITPVSLPAGTYWLAYLPSDNNLAFRKVDTSNAPSRLYSFTYGTLPNTYSTTPQTTPSHWSFYATLSFGGTNPPPPPPPTKIGDINNDNQVNITDLSLLLSSYGQNTTQCITNTSYACDLSSPGDGVVNIFDLSILLSKYGS